MTTKKAYSKHRPALDYFLIFGYITYMHILDEKRKKVDDKGKKYIILRISKQSKAYKLFNSIAVKMVIN